MPNPFKRKPTEKDTQKKGDSYERQKSNEGLPPPEIAQEVQKSEQVVFNNGGEENPYVAFRWKETATTNKPVVKVISSTSVTSTSTMPVGNDQGKSGSMLQPSSSNNGHDSKPPSPSSPPNARRNKPSPKQPTAVGPAALLAGVINDSVPEESRPRRNSEVGELKPEPPKSLRPKGSEAHISDAGDAPVAPPRDAARKITKFFGSDAFKEGTEPTSERDKQQLELQKHFNVSEPIAACSGCSFVDRTGTLYLTDFNIYYYSPLPFEQKVTIPLVDILSISSKSKAVVEITTTKDTFNFTALMHKDFIKMIETAFKPYLPTAFSLHRAIKKADLDRVNALIGPSAKKYPFDINEQDEEGQIPLQAAVRSANRPIVDLFLQYYKRINIDINVKDAFGWTILHIAVYYNTSSPQEDEVLKLLLDFTGITVDVKNQDMNTPLHYFCQKFTSPSCVELGEILIKKHVENGSHVNLLNKNGETPLHKAIFNASVRLLMVQLLISHGADVNVPTTRRGETALHYAVRLGRRDLVKLLLHAGADIRAKTQEGKTPFELIEKHQDKISEMLQRAQVLLDWLKTHILEEYLSMFLKEELYVDVLRELDDSTFDNIFGNKLSLPLGNRVRLRKAIAELKKQQPQEAPMLSKRDSSEVALKDLPPNLLQLKHDELEFTEVLGVGTFGKVYKGLYKFKKVAIKVLNASGAALDYEFRKELEVMSTVRAPNLVTFLGACFEPSVCFVMEYCKRGSLFSVLSDPNIEVDWDLAFKWFTGMANGLLTLHTWNPPLFHRDIKSLNILITSNWTAKITDFGLSRFDSPTNRETLTKFVGTVGWCAPEMFSGTSYSDKADIYSLSMVIWEIVVRVLKGTYEQPFKEFPQFGKNVQIMYQVAINKLRPTIAANTPVDLANLIKRGWDNDPEMRPSIQQLKREFEAIYEHYQKHPDTWMTQPCLPLSNSSTVPTSVPAAVVDLPKIEVSLPQPPKEPQLDNQLKRSLEIEMKNKQDEDQRKQEEQKRKQEEEKRKQEEDVKRKQDEIRKKQEEDLKKKLEEDMRRKQEEDLKRKQDEIRKKQEEDFRRKQEEDLKRKQEEDLRRKQEEIKRKQEEDLKRKQEEDFRRKQDEIRKKQEEDFRRKQEEDLKRKQDEDFKRKQDEIRKKQEEDFRRKQEEDFRRKQEEDFRRKQEEEFRRKQEEELKRKQEEMRRKQEEIKKKQEEDTKRVEQKLKQENAAYKLPTKESDVFENAYECMDATDSIIPSAQLRQQVGWCGKISREEAEQRLKGNLWGTFLLRWSDRANSYVLSYCLTGEKFAHIGNIFPGGKGKIIVKKQDKTEQQFGSLLEFISSAKTEGVISQPVHTK